MKKTILLLTTIVSLNASEISSKYFYEVSTGLSHMSVKQNDQIGSIILGESPDKNGYNLNMNLGYNYSDDTFVTIGLNHQAYHEVKLYNYLASYNKRLDYQYNPYVGIVGGVSYIELTKSPMPSVPIMDELGRRLALGFQMGTEHKLDKKYTLFTQYQYLHAKHKTKLVSNPAVSQLVQNDYSSFSIGVRW